MPLWALRDSDLDFEAPAPTMMSGADPPSKWHSKQTCERADAPVSAEVDRRLRTSLEEFLTFKDCEELLRATTLSVVMQRGAHIFNTPAGSRETYELSRVADRIDVFLSHNWSTPRYAKFLTLVYEYNFNVAVGVLLIASLAITVASSQSAFLEVSDKTVDDSLLFDESNASGCKLLSVSIFFVSLFLCRDVGKSFRMHGPSFFLDKCCIDQVDRKVQQHGIRKLGAFLSKSQRMLVLYSDIYLQKLWTIYELASFLALHDLKSLKMIPVSQPKTLFVLIACWELYHVVIVALRTFQSFGYFAYCLCLIGGYCLMLFLRVWERDKAAIRQRVTNFRVEESVCANEADRPLVYFNIQCLMQGTGLVASGCTLDDALSTFNQLVRTTLPNAFLSMEGSHMFRFRDYLLFGFAAEGVEAMDWCAALWLRGHPVRIVLSELLYHLVWMACWPSSLAVAERACSYKIFLRGWREKLLVALWLLPIFAVSAAINELADHARVQARDSDLDLALLIVLVLLTWIACVALCWGRRPIASKVVSELPRTVTDALSIKSSIDHKASDDSSVSMASI